MKKDFIEELKWRGMIHDMVPGVEELLKGERVSAYVGFDPTADSLHIGHLVGVMMLKLLQECGHTPIVLLGGATGMIGDPSGKSAERNLLTEETLAHFQVCIKKQLGKLIDFDSNKENAAVMVNNYDWMKEQSFLGFIRDVGKLITVNYMMAKDSVKKRLSGEGEGMSFTEFTYQLVQGFDFIHLYENNGCKVQMGGSDQWGNITTGTELIRRKLGGENKAYGITWPLIKKADGTKFGKTESGNIWLDAKYTSPYKFYQFWLNVSDADAESYIKIFTMLNEKEVMDLIEKHNQEPHMRELQKCLAKELTITIHSVEEFEKAVKASDILFGKSTADDLMSLDAETLLQVFEGVPQFTITKEQLGGSFIELFADSVAVFPSKGDLRRLVKGGGISINKQKVEDAEMAVTAENLIADKYILIQKGKKNYTLIVVE